MQAYFRALIFIGLLVALVAAAPSPHPIQKRGVFKVERTLNPNFRGRNGPKQLLKSLRKYRMKVSPELMDAIRNQSSATTSAAFSDDRFTSDKAAAAKPNTLAATNGTGQVTATPEQGDVEYISPVTIGGQTINMDFDSGSSDLWVFSTQLSAADTKGHTVYNPKKSTSLKMLQGATWSISYGDGSGAAGNVGTDTVNIGGATVTSQAVEMATTVASSFVEDTNSNGLVGLAFSKLNTVQPQQQKTFFDNVKSSLADTVFTADLRPSAVGAYTFGSIDSSKFNGTMNWVAVNTTQGFWQFSSTKFAVGTGKTQTGDATGQAIADTGTTLIIANPTTVQGYYSQVQGATNNAQVGGYTVPCDADLPDLMLDIGGSFMARVKGQDINYASVGDGMEAAKSMVSFVSFVQDLDHGKLTQGMPVTFILRRFLRVCVDFGDIGLKWTGTTFQDWTAKYGAEIAPANVDTFNRRLRAMREYLAEHGVIKAFALLNDEFVRMADSVTDEDLAAVYGVQLHPLDKDQEYRQASSP